MQGSKMISTLGADAVPDGSQLESFLETCVSLGPYRVFFNLLAKAGLRPGEAYALQPGDLDLEGERTVRVERAWTGTAIKATKTEEMRAVDLTPELVTLLREHLRWLKTEALRRGWGEPVWLFPNEDGKPLDESRVRKVYRGVLKRGKSPTFRLYDLRHTFASLLLAYVSAQLGHANPATTLRYYARWIPTGGRRWVEVLDHSPSKIGTKSGHQKRIGEPGVPELPDSFGGPSRTRTWDPLIKSQLLYQLS
jgi:integrase